MTSASQPERPKKRRRYGCLRLLLYFFAFCLIAPIIAYFSWTTYNGYLVNQLVKEIRERGEPITLEELEKSITVPKGEVDTTDIWQRGFKPLQSDEYEASTVGIPFVSKLEEKDLPKLGRVWEGLAEAEAFIAKHQHSLDAFHEAAEKGGYAAFPPDYSGHMLEAYSGFEGMSHAAKLLRLELEVRAHQSDARGVARSLNTLWLGARAIDNEPGVPAQLTACAFDRLAAQGLANVLFRLDFTREELAGFQAVLRTKNPAKSMANALIGDRALEFAILSDRNLIEPKPPFSPFNSDRLHFLHYMTRHIEAMKKGFPDGAEEMDRLETDLLQFSAWAQYFPLPWNYSHPLVSMTLAVYPPTANRIIHAAAADLAINIELYRREHGRLPRSLEDLIPNFIKEIPQDPYSGQPLVYRLTPYGFKIYGLYWPAIDDGGNFGEGKMRTWDSGIEFLVARELEPIEKKPEELSIEQWLEEQQQK